MISKLKPKSEFSRNVLTLMTGTTISQAIPIAISPILTRIYTPEDFGVLAIYMSFSSFLSVIVTGRYELAVMLPKKDSDALNIVVLSFLISLLISIISFIIIFIFNTEIAILLKNVKIANWLYLIPMTVLLTGIYQSLNYWNNRKKNYKLISTSRVTQSTTTGVSNISLGFLGYTYGGMILGWLFGQTIATFILVKQFLKQDTITFNVISKIKIIALAKKYKKFPLINAFHSFINIFKENFVSIFIALKYSQASLGHYFFMLRFMKLPAGLLGSSIAQVFYREASEQYNKDKDIQNLVLSLIKKLALIAVVPITLFYLFAEDIFFIVFGEEWKIAGSYAKAIAPYIFFHFIASPLGMIPLIVNKQEKAFFWGLAESILFVLSFTMGYYIYSDIYSSIYLLSIVFSVYFPIYYLWIYKISKETER